MQNKIIATNIKLVSDKLKLSGIETINPKLPLKKSSVVVVLDIHGTVLEPNWKEEYLRLHRKIFEKEASCGWIEEKILYRTDREISEILSEKAGKTPQQVYALIRTNRYEFRETYIPPVKEHFLDFITALKNKNFPVYMISGSTKSRIIKQLKANNIINFPKTSTIIGRSDIREKYNRKDVLLELKNRYPEHTLLHFDDWFPGAQEIDRPDIIFFGLPQGNNEEFQQNREKLIGTGFDYIMNGWSGWQTLIHYIG